MCMLPCVRGDAVSDVERRVNELEAHLHTLERQHAWYEAAVDLLMYPWLFGVLCLYVVTYPDRWPLVVLVWYAVLIPAVYAL